MTASKRPEELSAAASIASSMSVSPTPIVPYTVPYFPSVEDDYSSRLAMQYHKSAVMGDASNLGRAPKQGTEGVAMALEVLMPHQRPIPEFLYQLTQMLSDSVNSNVIEWNGASRSVIVHDPVRLEAEILQKYFRHSRFASFQRQLNYFGFRKKAGKGRMSPCSYLNEAATEDLRSLLLIKRKRTRRSGQARSRGEASETETSTTEAETTEAETASSDASASDARSDAGRSTSLEEPIAEMPSIIEHPNMQSPDPPDTKDPAFQQLSFMTHSHEYGPPGTIDFEPTNQFSLNPTIYASNVPSGNNAQLLQCPATAAAAALPILPQLCTATNQAQDASIDLVSAFPMLPQFQQVDSEESPAASTSTDSDIRRLVSFLNRNLPSADVLVSSFNNSA